MSSVECSENLNMPTSTEAEQTHGGASVVVDTAFQTVISLEKAKNDLMVNPCTPFLFRKYMNLYWEKMTKEWEQSYPTLSDAQKSQIRKACGDHLQSILSRCSRCNPYREFFYDPVAEYTMANFIGPCSVYCGPPVCAHTGGEGPQPQGSGVCSERPLPSLLVDLGQCTWNADVSNDDV